MIPKKIHYFWIGGTPKPESAIYCIESWKKFCPDYEIIEWNETNYDFTKNEYMRQALEAKKWSFVTDFARLDVIYRHGGIYFDTDVELLGNIDHLLENGAFFGFDRTKDPSKNNVNTGEGFGAEAGHPVLKEMMEVYSDRQFVKPDGSYDFTPTPLYTTKCLQRRGLENRNADQRLSDGVTIYASDVLCPKSFGETKLHLTERTVSIHHFDATWLDGDLKRKHERSCRINKLFGEKLGFRIDRMVNDAEYLQNAFIRTVRNWLRNDEERAQFKTKKR